MNLTLFDLDGTLLPRDSDHAFGEFVVALGWADRDDFRRRNDAFYDDYVAGRLDIDAYVDFATAPWRNRPAEDLARATARFLDEVVRPMLHPSAVGLVQQHQREGDLVAIVTATNDFVTRPIAGLMGVDQLIATDLARDETGRVIGTIQGMPAFREGKITRLENWMVERGWNLESFADSTFYSDSLNDLPLLRKVRHPVAANPDATLRAHAEQHGWPIINLR